MGSLHRPRACECGGLEEDATKTGIHHGASFSACIKAALSGFFSQRLKHPHCSVSITHYLLLFIELLYSINFFVVASITILFKSTEKMCFFFFYRMLTKLSQWAQSYVELTMSCNKASKAALVVNNEDKKKSKR